MKEQTDPRSAALGGGEAHLNYTIPPTPGRMVRFSFADPRGQLVERPAMVLDTHACEGTAVERCDLAVFVKPKDTLQVTDQGGDCMVMYMYADLVPCAVARVPEGATGPLARFIGQWAPGFWHWPEIQQQKAG